MSRPTLLIVDHEMLAVATASEVAGQILNLVKDPGDRVILYLEWVACRGESIDLQILSHLAGFPPDVKPPIPLRR